MNTSHEEEVERLVELVRAELRRPKPTCFPVPRSERKLTPAEVLEREGRADLLGEVIDCLGEEIYERFASKSKTLTPRSSKPEDAPRRRLHSRTSRHVSDGWIDGYYDN